MVDQIYKKLDEFKNLVKNWDGHNGFPIQEKPLKNAKEFIEKLPKDIKKLPDPVPINNGGISILWSLNDLYIDIEFHTDGTYSFYAEHPELNEIEIENQTNKAHQNTILKNYIQYIL